MPPPPVIIAVHFVTLPSFPSSDTSLSQDRRQARSALASRHLRPRTDLASCLLTIRPRLTASLSRRRFTVIVRSGSFSTDPASLARRFMTASPESEPEAGGNRQAAR